TGMFHSVSNARDELTERRELFRLREPLPQRRALSLEPRLASDVARHQDASDGMPFLVDERRGRQEKRASKTRIFNGAAARRRERRIDRRNPGGGSRSDEFCDGPF